MGPRENVLALRSQLERGRHYEIVHEMKMPFYKFFPPKSSPSSHCSSSTTTATELLSSSSASLSPSSSSSSPRNLVEASDAATLAKWIQAFSEAIEPNSPTRSGISTEASPSPSWLKCVPTATAETRSRLLVSTKNAWFVEQDGRLCSVCAVSATTKNYSRLATVYTPPEDRGKGHCSWLIKEVCALLSKRSTTPCLFTDEGDSISNSVYQKCGFVLDSHFLMLKFDFGPKKHPSP